MFPLFLTSYLDLLSLTPISLNYLTTNNMDIDSPPAAAPSNTALNLPTFSSAFPLPFRVLALIGLAIVLWAINVHVLTLLGVDFASAVDLGAPDGNDKVQEDRDTDRFTREGEHVDNVLFEYNRNNHHHHHQNTNQQSHHQIASMSQSAAAPPVEFSDDLPRPSFDGYGRIVGSPAAAGTGGGTTVGTRAVFAFPSSRNGSVVSFPGDGNDDGDDDGGEEKNRDRPTPPSVYRSIYSLFVVYSIYVSTAWLLFRLITRPTTSEISHILNESPTSGNGNEGTTLLTWEEASGRAERIKMERYRAFVGLAVGGLAVMGFGTGFGYGRWKVGERERQSLLRCVLRLRFVSYARLW